LAWTVLCHALLIAIHPYKLPRFAFTLAPVLWLLGAWLLLRGLDALFQGLPGRRWQAWGVLACAALLAVGVGSEFHREKVEVEWRVRTVPATVAPTLDRIAELAVEEQGTLVLGTWNLLSPALVQWHFRRLHPEAVDHLPRTVFPSSKARRRVARDLPEIEQVLLVEPLASMPPDLAAVAWQENAWLEPLRTALEQGGSHPLTAEETWEDGGYRLRIFRKTGATRQP
jgi:hypothetical protein